MLRLTLILAILGVFGGVLWHAREPNDGSALDPDMAARVHTVDLADAPAFQASEPAGLRPTTPPAPEPEPAEAPEAPKPEEPATRKALETGPEAAPPAPADVPIAIVAGFDADRSAQLVRRLLSVYTRLRMDDTEVPAP